MWAKRLKWEKNICFIRFLHAMGKELLLGSFIGRLLWGWYVWCWSQTELESENVLNWNGQGLNEWVKVTQLCLTFWDPHGLYPNDLWNRNRFTNVENRLLTVEEEGALIYIWLSNLGKAFLTGLHSCGREMTCGCQTRERRIQSLGLADYIGWINSKVLLYTTGNYIQYHVTNHNRIWKRIHRYKTIILLHSRN